MLSSVIFWSWRQWLAKPGRAALATLAYAAVIGLTIVFDGVHVGVLADLDAYPASLPADLVAMEKGSTSFSMSPSRLPALSSIAALSVPGVSSVSPIGLVPFIFERDSVRTPALLVAYEDAGEPHTLTAGSLPRAAQQIVFDSRLARLYGIGVGDSVAIWDTELTVTGLSTGTSSPFSPYVFVTLEGFQDLAERASLQLDPGAFTPSALLINTDQAAGADVRSDLQQALPNATLMTPEELGRAEADFGDRLVGPILILISSITWIMALLTMAMLRYADVRADIRQFGIHKAIGAQPIWLALALAIGGLWIALPALPLSVLMAILMAKITSAWNPLYVAQIFDAGVLSRGVGVALLFSVLGGLLVWRRLAKVDPVLVFQR